MYVQPEFENCVIPILNMKKLSASPKIKEKDFRKIGFDNNPKNNPSIIATTFSTRYLISTIIFDI